MKRLTIDIEDDEQIIYTVECVLKQIHDGNTRGFYPTWHIKDVKQ
jgi:hypothetical protein